MKSKLGKLQTAGILIRVILTSITKPKKILTLKFSIITIIKFMVIKHISKSYMMLHNFPVINFHVFSWKRELFQIAYMDEKYFDKLCIMACF